MDPKTIWIKKVCYWNFCIPDKTLELLFVCLFSANEQKLSSPGLFLIIKWQYFCFRKNICTLQVILQMPNLSLIVNWSIKCWGLEMYQKTSRRCSKFPRCLAFHRRECFLPNWWRGISPNCCWQIFLLGAFIWRRSIKKDFKNLIAAIAKNIWRNNTLNWSTKSKTTKHGFQYASMSTGRWGELSKRNRHLCFKSNNTNLSLIQPWKAFAFA